MSESERKLYYPPKLSFIGGDMMSVGECAPGSGDSENCGTGSTADQWGCATGPSADLIQCAAGGVGANEGICVPGGDGIGYDSGSSVAAGSCSTGTGK